jgi:hypothetical protein
MKFIIVNIAVDTLDSGCFWSNEHGWTALLDEATVYEEEWIRKVNLPLDGIWAIKPGSLS